MKELKLRKGFYVNDWSGDITPIFYNTVKAKYYGSTEDKFIMFTEEGVLEELLPEYKRNQICATKKEAVIVSMDSKKKRREYYEKQIEEYKQNLKEL